MRPIVNRSVCIGAANCVAIAPQVFELDNQGLSRVIGAGLADDAVLRAAAEECPVQAITLVDDAGKQVYP